MAVGGPFPGIGYFLQSLSSTQLGALTTAQVRALHADGTGVGALTGDRLSSLSTAAVRALTTAQVSQLTSDQIQQLTATQAAALTSSMLAIAGPGACRAADCPVLPAITFAPNQTSAMC